MNPRLPFDESPRPPGDRSPTSYLRSGKPVSSNRPGATLRPPVRRADPATSRAAAARLNPESIMGKVYAALIDHGPLADHQIAAVLGIAEGSARKRRADLKSIGLVEETGRTIKSPSGCDRIVWGVRCETT